LTIKKAFKQIFTFLILNLNFLVVDESFIPIFLNPLTCSTDLHAVRLIQKYIMKDILIYKNMLFPSVLAYFLQKNFTKSVQVEGIVGAISC
jgi:hypothetical protein